MATNASFEKDLTCPVCRDIFKDPVVLGCSHSFCRVCLQRCWESRGSRECPICRRRSSCSVPPNNLALKNIVESYLEKNAASTAPEKNEVLCSLHGERLLFICEDEQEGICVMCQAAEELKIETYTEDDASRSVTCTVINNTANVYLKDARVYIDCGQNKDPPKSTVRPQGTETCSFTKRFGAFGVAGVLMYDIYEDDKDSGKSLAVMFSVPYHYAFCTNRFAVGFVRSSKECNEQLFKMMYEKQGEFTGGKADGGTVNYEKDGWCVSAAMSPHQKSKLNIELTQKWV